MSYLTDFMKGSFESNSEARFTASSLRDGEFFWGVFYLDENGLCQQRSNCSLDGGQCRLFDMERSGCCGNIDDFSTCLRRMRELFRDVVYDDGGIVCGRRKEELEELREYWELLRDFDAEGRKSII